VIVKRFTSSMYSTFPFAFPSTPISNFRLPPEAPPPGPGSPPPPPHGPPNAFSARSPPPPHGTRTAEPPRTSRARHLVAQQRPANTSEPAPRHHLLRRKHRRERPHAVVFPRPFSPRQKHPPIRGVHSVHKETLLQQLLPHQALKGNVFIESVHRGQGTDPPCRGYARKISPGEASASARSGGNGFSSGGSPAGGCGCPKRVEILPHSLQAAQWVYRKISVPRRAFRRSPPRRRSPTFSAGPPT